MKIINFEKKKNEVIKEQQESKENAQIFCICKEIFENKYLKDKKIFSIFLYIVRDHYHYTGEYEGAVHSICNLKYSVPKRFLLAFHNGGNMIIILS